MESLKKTVCTMLESLSYSRVTYLGQEVQRMAAVVQCIAQLAVDGQNLRVSPATRSKLNHLVKSSHNVVPWLNFISLNLEAI